MNLRLLKSLTVLILLSITGPTAPPLAQAIAPVATSGFIGTTAQLNAAISALGAPHSGAVTDPTIVQPISVPGLGGIVPISTPSVDGETYVAILPGAQPLETEYIDIDQRTLEQIQLRHREDSLFEFTLNIKEASNKLATISKAWDLDIDSILKFRELLPFKRLLEAIHSPLFSYLKIKDHELFKDSPLNRKGILITNNGERTSCQWPPESGNPSDTLKREANELRNLLSVYAIEEDSAKKRIYSENIGAIVRRGMMRRLYPNSIILYEGRHSGVFDAIYAIQQEDGSFHIVPVEDKCHLINSGIRRTFRTVLGFRFQQGHPVYCLLVVESMLKKLESDTIKDHLKTNDPSFASQKLSWALEQIVVGLRKGTLRTIILDTRILVNQGVDSKTHRIEKSRVSVRHFETGLPNGQRDKTDASYFIGNRVKNEKIRERLKALSTRGNTRP